MTDQELIQLLKEADPTMELDEFKKYTDMCKQIYKEEKGENYYE